VSNASIVALSRRSIAATRAGAVRFCSLSQSALRRSAALREVSRARRVPPLGPARAEWLLDPLDWEAPAACVLHICLHPAVPQPASVAARPEWRQACLLLIAQRTVEPLERGLDVASAFNIESMRARWRRAAQWACPKIVRQATSSPRRVGVAS